MVSTTDEKNTEAPKRSPAAERMRLHRERRRDGVRCFRIQLYEDEVDELIRRGLLNPEWRHEHNAVVNAFHEFLKQVFPEVYDAQQ